MLDWQTTLSLLTIAALAGSGLGYLAVLAADRLSEPLDKPDELPQGHDTDRFAEAVGAMLIGAGIVILFILTLGLSDKAVLATAFAITLLTLSLIDLRHFVLPDALTLPLLWTGLLINVWGYFAALQDAVIGAVVGYMSLWSIYWLFKLLRGKEGLGYGDFKLTAAIGAWLGWQALPTVVFSAAIGGLCVGLFLMVTKRMPAEQPLPFGPFLAGAGFIALTTDYTFWGWLL
jgi:leader peptidase (prepilin peptidase)/N-methyltransferase